MKGLSKVLAIALETVGCAIVISGISIECVMRADIGYVLITSGSLVIAGGSLMFAKIIRMEK